MKILISALFLVTSSIVAGQRPSFAGFRPIGFPEMANRTTTTPDPLGNRFGDNATEKLPIEANGDRELIDRLSKLPVDKQPFWFINWQAYEKHRKEPQTFPQRPSGFVDNVPINANLPSVNSGFSIPSPGLVGTEPNAVISRFGPTPTSSSTSQLSSNFGAGSNFNNSGNFNSGGNNPSGNVYPTANPNLNVYPAFNPNLNVYPTANPNLNVYPTVNPNLNVYPTANPNFNTYPNSNSNLNNYPNGNTNNYTNGNTNNYPTGNFNNYPSVNSNTNVFHSSNFNTQSNSGTTKDGVSYYQTTQNYKWNTSWKTTNASPTNVNKYPANYPRADTYPQRSGGIF